MPPRKRADRNAGTLAAEPEARLQRPPDMPRPDGDDKAALAAYLTQRFLDTWQHPFWTNFRRQCQEDHDFHTGGPGQWDKTQRAKLISKEKAALSINAIRPVIRMIEGYEAATPLEAKPIPVGQEDAAHTEVFERVFKHASKQAQTEFESSAIFKDGIIGGLGVGYVGVDYTDDFIHGTPSMQRVPWDEFVYDPGARRYDLLDARELFWAKMVAVDDLKAQFPTKAEEIDAALSRVSAAGPLAGLSGLDLPARDRQDGYKAPPGVALSMYDPQHREVLVVEGWYRVWKWESVLLDKRLNRVTPLPPEVVSVGQVLAQADPLVTIVKKPRREFEMCVFLPATQQYLSGGQPFENDTAAHPFGVFVVYREGDEMLGEVRNLKDPQRDVNKRRSARADAAARAGRFRHVAHRRSIENPEALEDDTWDVLWMASPGLTGYKELAPGQYPDWLARGDLQGKEEIQQVSLSNAPFQGQETGQSGIAIAHLKQQGQIGSAPTFRNHRRTRHIHARRFGKRVQQCYGVEKILRLDQEAGPEWVTLNERIVTENGTVQVLNNIVNLEWDVEMVDAPMTPTARLSALVTLLELLSKVPPEYAEALLHLVIGYADPPQKEEVVRIIRAMQTKRGVNAEALQAQAQALAQRPPAPAGGNGGPGRLPPAGVTPGFGTKVMAGAPGMDAGAMNTPAADNLRMMGGMA